MTLNSVLTLEYYSELMHDADNLSLVWETRLESENQALQKAAQAARDFKVGYDHAI